MPNLPPAKPHYPLTTRLLIELYAKGQLPNVSSLDIEARYGYVGRISYHDGGVRLFRRTNVGVNNHGAAEMSKDKGYTKYFLQQLGFPTPRGSVFLLPQYRHLIAQNLSRFGFDDYNEVQDIKATIEREWGYPVFIKPNEESQGKGIYKCHSPAEVDAAVAAAVAAGEDKIIVEEAVPGADYRIVLLWGRVICAYRREPLQVQGDGQRSIADLLQALKAEHDAQGRDSRIDPADPRLAHTLKRSGHNMGSVLAAGEVLRLADFSNLSAGGTAQDVSEHLHPRWAEVALSVTAALGLDLCGVDLLCTDIEDPTAAYSIIESNASPGLDNYAALGLEQMARVRDFYREIFNHSPKSGGG